MGYPPQGTGGVAATSIFYAPRLQDSGDLEAATKTISATSEQGSADYSSSLTIATPSDSRITVTRLAIRIQVTIDSFAGGGTTLNYRLKRAGTSIKTGTLSTGASTGAKYKVLDLTTGTLTGAATYELFLWVNAGSCVVSVAEIWVGIGTTVTTANPVPSDVVCLNIAFSGWVSIAARSDGVGGTSFAMILLVSQNNTISTDCSLATSSTLFTIFNFNGVIVSGDDIVAYQETANALLCIDYMSINLLE